jgi:SAM-dependent methyltransferase
MRFQSFRILRFLLRKNGLLWVVSFGTAELLRRAFVRADARLKRLEQKRGLPSFFSAEIGGELWSMYDWSRGGEEWTCSEEWKSATVEAVMKKYMRQGDAVLEIGPGGGRWTEPLLSLASTVVGVDVAEACVIRCRERFGNEPRATFMKGDGRTLTGIASDSIDTVWSYDVFVHVCAEDAASYLREIARVLRRDGRAVIHHPADGGIAGVWRSRMTADQFAQLATDAGLAVIEQLREWDHGGERFDLRTNADAVTVLRLAHERGV